MTHTKRGKLLTLEGTEGAGKSTAAAWLVPALQAAGITVVHTREPGGTALGEAIREVLLADHGQPMPAMSELLLMFASRAAHLSQIIEPALAAGQWVVCDRFTDASYAYQGAGRGLGAPAVAALEQLVQDTLRPDRVFWFDLPVAIGLERVRSRGVSNRFDGEELRFHETVRAAYADRAGAEPERYVRIDATADPAGVQRQLQTALDALS